MADYSYETGGYPGRGENWGAPLGQALARIGIEHRKKTAMLDTVQGYLNVAKGITTTDPKTGKPKPFFTPDQLATVQNLVNQGKAYQAGSAASALGIGKNLAQRAEAANAQSYNAANQHVLRNGVRYNVNPKTGAETPDTGKPVNQYGQTAEQQFNDALKLRGFDQRTLAAHNKGVDQMLKNAGVNRTNLFDPSAIQPGTVSKDGSFVPVGGTPTPTPTPQGLVGETQAIGDKLFGNFGGQSTPTPTPTPEATPPPDPTHYLVGARPPSISYKQELDSNGKATGNFKPVMLDNGSAGTVMSIDRFQSLQDEAAKGGAPIIGYDGKPYDPQQALDWMRNPANVANNPAIAASIQKGLVQSVTGQGVNSVAPSGTFKPDVETGNSGTTQPVTDTSGDTGSDTSDNEDQ